MAMHILGIGNEYVLDQQLRSWRESSNTFVKVWRDIDSWIIPEIILFKQFDNICQVGGPPILPPPPTHYHDQVI